MHPLSGFRSDQTPSMEKQQAAAQEEDSDFPRMARWYHVAALGLNTGIMGCVTVWNLVFAGGWVRVQWWLYQCVHERRRRGWRRSRTSRAEECMGAWVVGVVGGGSAAICVSGQVCVRLHRTCPSELPASSGDCYSPPSPVSWFTHWHLIQGRGTNQVAYRTVHVHLRSNVNLFASSRVAGCGGGRRPGNRSSLPPAVECGLHHPAALQCRAHVRNTVSIGVIGM